MANDKKLEEMLLSATPKELSVIRDLVDSKISENDIIEAQKPKKQIIVENFNYKKVEPFSAQAIYDVFNKVNKSETAMNGEMVIGLFGRNDDEKKNFEAKLYGGVHQQGTYRIKFRHFEID